jgi:hypothetical protein
MWPPLKTWTRLFAQHPTGALHDLQGGENSSTSGEDGDDHLNYCTLLVGAPFRRRRQMRTKSPSSLETSMMNASTSELCPINHSNDERPFPTKAYVVVDRDSCLFLRSCWRRDWAELERACSLGNSPQRRRAARTFRFITRHSHRTGLHLLLMPPVWDLPLSIFQQVVACNPHAVFVATSCFLLDIMKTDTLYTPIHYICLVSHPPLLPAARDISGDDTFSHHTEIVECLVKTAVREFQRHGYVLVRPLTGHPSANCGADTFEHVRNRRISKRGSGDVASFLAVDERCLDESSPLHLFTAGCRGISLESTISLYWLLLTRTLWYAPTAAAVDENRHCSNGDESELSVGIDQKGKLVLRNYGDRLRWIAPVTGGESCWALMCEGKYALPCNTPLSTLWRTFLPIISQSVVHQRLVPGDTKSSEPCTGSPSNNVPSRLKASRGCLAPISFEAAQERSVEIGTLVWGTVLALQQVTIDLLSIEDATPPCASHPRSSQANDSWVPAYVKSLPTSDLFLNSDASLVVAWVQCLLLLREHVCRPGLLLQGIVTLRVPIPSLLRFAVCCVVAPRAESGPGPAAAFQTQSCLLKRHLAPERPVLHAAFEVPLQVVDSSLVTWSEHVHLLIESFPDDVTSTDCDTQLPAALLAAARDVQIDTIYCLLRRAPSVVRGFQ